MTAEERADALLDVMRRLSALFDEEVALIRHQLRPRVNELSDSKQALARAYEEVARALRVDGDGLKSLDAETRQTLAETTRTLNAACRRNLLVLKAHCDSHRGIIDAIVQGINKDRHAESGYGLRRGAIALGSRAARLNPPPATVNTQL